MKKTLKIKAYLKPHCGWSKGVRAIMQKYSLDYEDVDIVNYPQNYEAMVKESGQPLSPCVKINEVMLADVSGEEVENYLLSHDLVKRNDKEAEAPTNSSCTPEEHAAMHNMGIQTETIRFF